MGLSDEQRLIDRYTVIRLAKESGVWIDCAEQAEAIQADELERFASLVAQEQMERDAKDTERFAWYFSDKPKGDWLMTYLDGVRIGWTTDQWRDAIDAAIRAQKESNHG